MSPTVALVALYCVAAQPAPIVNDEVHRALLGQPVPKAPAPADVAAAIAAVTPLRKRSHR